MSKSLEEKVLATIEKYNMLEPGDKVLLAVSGGPDSLTLFHLFLRFQSRFNLALHIFHLDHRVRKESAEDAAFVKKLAEEAGLGVTILSYDVPAYVKKARLSLQEGARQIRYKMMKQVAQEVGANKIALGHQADDQAETFLQRILRGAGSKGLAGMPPVRGSFIRPLIEVTREEIETYCQENNFKPRFDRSNLSPAYQRNRLRRELIPFLVKKYNPNLREVLCREAEILAEEHLLLEELTVEKFNQIASYQDGLLRFDLAAFSKLPLALKRRLLRKGIEKVKGDLRGIEFEHIEAIIKGDLPSGLVAFKEYNTLVIARRSALKKPELKPLRMKAPGKVELPTFQLELEAGFVKPDEVKFSQEVTQAFLDADKLSFPLILRTRRPGDRFQPLGMEGTKKLQDFFVDEKIPVRQRDRALIVESEGEIVWLVGYRISDQFKVTKKTRRVLVLVARSVRAKCRVRSPNAPKKGNDERGY